MASDRLNFVSGLRELELGSRNVWVLLGVKGKTLVQIKVLAAPERESAWIQLSPI